MKRILGLVCFLSLVLTSNANATDESFDATITLLAPIVITETQALSFPDTIAGAITDVTVAPADGTAALFTATGEASASIARSIVEASIDMTDGSTNISVDTFVLSGAVAFDGTGNINDFRIGATAHVEAADAAGAYTGSATFRVVYQ